MIDAELLSFSIIAFVLAITPGADVALVIRNAISRGRRAALLTTAGICTACAVHAVASSLGLSVILATSATAFEVVKFVGAAYLIFLGVNSILGARQIRADLKAADQGAPSVQSRSAWASLLEGMLTNLLNPKVAVFYLLVLPKFIAPNDAVFGQSMLLAGIHIGFGFMVLFACTLFVDRLRTWLQIPKIKSRIETVTGGILVLLGLRLAIERR